MQTAHVMHLTLRQVTYFVAVAEAGSVSRAATRLNISQSAMTESLRALEAQTGATLFDRTSKGVTLTYQGHQFLSHSRRIMATVADAGRIFATSPDSISGPLNLGFTSLVSGYFLADLLARFRRIFPNVLVNVVEEVRPSVEQLLAKGELHIALMLVSNMENRGALQFETLVRSRNRVWLPASHRLLTQDEVELTALEREPLIALSMDEMPQATAALWPSTCQRPNFTMSTSSIDALRSLVATGAGWAIMPDIAYRPWSLEGDRLEARPIQGVETTLDVGIAWRRGSELSEQAQIFLNLSREYRGERPSDRVSRLRAVL
jgi:DNA-binding transcriptional LysR family regulator